MATAYQATALLAASGLGAVLAIFWHANGGGFVAGLFSHGLTAASIGGLADWFAVTAIFRRPLGIGWRTDILRRHRARMTKELVEFSSVDLLSRENIMTTLAKEDFAKMLLTYLIERGGDEAADGAGRGFCARMHRKSGHRRTLRRLEIADTRDLGVD